MDELISRLEAARAAIAARRGALAGGEPWPLSAAYGIEPESDWGPKEVLAHSAEMLAYWLAQIEGILAAPPENDPIPFGRVVSDSDRIGRIGSDRELPAGELVDRIDAGTAAVAERLRTLGALDQDRRGLHATAGALTVPAIVERFVVGHLEDHVAQLDRTIGT